METNLKSSVQDLTVGKQHLSLEYTLFSECVKYGVSFLCYHVRIKGIGVSNARPFSFIHSAGSHAVLNHNHSLVHTKSQLFHKWFQCTAGI